MEIEKELNAKILAKTSEILLKYPELSELLNEMPITIPNKEKPEINIKVLKDYYDSLNNILKDYINKSTSDEN
jgi:hypothetical protein